MLRSGYVWFFTPSNPKITFGGMEGESKKEMYDLLPSKLFPKTFYVSVGEEGAQIFEQIEEQQIVYPFVVKPLCGEQGILFRKIDTAAELKNYHSKVPVDYIVQEMLHYPVEVSVFYIRHPQQDKGTITGFLQKIPLHVTGDGKHTLAELVMHHPKGKKRIAALHSKHKENWDTIIPSGQHYPLSHAANHNRGAHFIDLKRHIDDRLLAHFDAISKDINDFFYGRYDIMCNSIEDLKAGCNFSILEFNGCGAEPNHFYDTGYTLPAAYREILKHWKALFRISMYNASMGIKPWPYQKGRNFRKEVLKQKRIMKEKDEEIE